MEPKILGTESRTDAYWMDAHLGGVEKKVEETEGGMRLESDTYAQHLLKGAGSLWQQVSLCDVTLEAEGVQFRAHRVILASVSSYCRFLFTKHPSSCLSERPVKLQGVSAQGLKHVLGLVYRGHMTLSMDMVEESLLAAQSLLIQDAIKACLHFLAISLSPETCPQILGMASRLGFPHLHSKALAYLGTHCHGLLRDPEKMLGLGPAALLQLLGRDDLGDISEVKLLRGALRWLEHKPNRASHAREVLSRVRLPLVPPEALLDELAEQPQVCADPICLQMLREALTYHVRPLLQPALQGPSTTIRGATPCLLVVGGRTEGNRVCQEVWATTERDVEWKRLGEMGAPLYNHCCVILNNFLFVLGGQHQFDPCGHQPTNEVHRYDPRTETWIQVAGMLQKRTRFHADVLSGALVAVAGGTMLGRLAESVEQYNPGQDRWELTTSYPMPVVDHAGATHKGILYISGGFSGGKTLSHLYSYLPRLKRWVPNRPLAISRCDHGMATVQDTIYCVGGRTLNKPMCQPSSHAEQLFAFQAQEWTHVNEMEFYCPAVDQWTTVRVSPLGCSQFSLTASGPQLYITGGASLRSRSKIRDVLTYASRDRKWERKGMLPLALVDHCACTLSISGEMLRRLQSQLSPCTPPSPAVSTLKLSVLE
ncbi:hypothetical protein AGOR_G00050950 [Albula goreensis]|uniref:BTB domain-containing protein n=1 Tax=Albula goreensis TaxID=1534307 RepID=A0A8T3DYT2_9TELE|nr:hypothetical protein AGOR_G00050950 [Albula goreensis]